MPTIDILLGTYNGSRFLEEQLQSLSAQSFPDWRLILRDDGSTDNSVEIVTRWAERSGADLLLIDDGERNTGACGNFGRLLARSDAPYFAFCDQDDVWREDKLSALLDAIKRAEEDLAAEVPVLSFCDLVPVDEGLVPIAPSFRAYSGLSVPSDGKIARHSMVQNIVTGCAMMGNAALRERSLPIPDVAMMHDWWVALVASSQGRMVDVPQPLVLYRQHGANTLGAKRGTLTHNLWRFASDPLASMVRTHKWVNGTIRQAAFFADAYRDALSPELERMFRDFGNIKQKSWPRRKLFPITHRLYTNSLARIVAIALAV